MARSKKPTEDLELEENLDAEVEEAEETLALESDDEEATDGEEEEAPAPKKARAPRKPRARKKTTEPSSLLASMSRPQKTEIPPTTETVTPEPDPFAEPAAISTGEMPRMPSTIDSQPGISQPVVNNAPIPTTLSGSPEMNHQLHVIKELSNAVVSHLEKANTVLKEAPKPVARPAAITKIAVGFSAFALVLSTVSLLLATSARQAAFDRPASAPIEIAAARPAKPNPLTIPGVIAQAEKEEAAKKKRPVNVARQKSQKTNRRKSR